FQDPQIGVDMMQFCKQILIQRGIDHLVFGQDIDHFFPGCPLDHGGLKDFLLIEGFDEGEPVSDLVMDLAEYSYSPKVDADIRSCTEADIAALDAFLGNAFPGRWRFDCLRKISHEGKSQFVDLLWIDGAVMGFSVTQTQECQLPIAGAVWARFHGDNWCALGPIGVSQAVRGQGFGDALLGASLARLRASGNRVCLIDWTSLTDWYGKHGFKPASTYLTFSLTLSL
ncbi:MAG: GNAT family N-acetyltransferase, partial [Fimbriimonadaceae bacterium]